MNKKYLIIVISAIILLFGTGIFIFTKSNTTLNSSIEAKAGDLILKNTSKASLKIITKDSSKIEINLVGPADQLKNVYFNKNADGPSEFSIPENSKGIKGTITVPQGVKIINLDLPPGVNFVVNQPSDNNAPVQTGSSTINRLGLGGSIGGGNEGVSAGNNGNVPGNNGEGGNNNGQNPPNTPNPPNNPNPPTPPNTPNEPNNPNPPTPPNTPTHVCGNGIVEPGEQCDDGNNANGDGCSYVCLFDTVLPVCGNGKVEPGEQCDDGNNVAGDGCFDCRLEFPLSTCGNLLLEPGEQCDDGNKVSGDGCSSTCQLESSLSVCGNGKLESGEECDDGNRVSGDGCSSLCHLETVQYTECTILLKQEERNQCCQEVNVSTPHDECTGYWLFDYNSRLCYWHCPPQNCSSPSTPALKNSCCATENNGKPTPPCAGDWIFDTTKNVCSFECTNFSANNTEGHSSQEIDQTSQYCKNTYTDENDINKCCDDFLKHPLSLGPHPGYPDCIGRWSIKPGTSTCQFDCSSYEDMTEILKQLQENSNNPQ